MKKIALTVFTLISISTFAQKNDNIDSIYNILKSD